MLILWAAIAISIKINATVERGDFHLWIPFMNQIWDTLEYLLQLLIVVHLH